MWDLNSLTRDGNSVAVEVQGPNHWTYREFPSYFFLFSHIFFFPSSLLFSSFSYVMVHLSFFIFFHSKSCGSIGAFSLTSSNPRLQLMLFRISFTLQKTKQNKPKFFLTKENKTLILHCPSHLKPSLFIQSIYREPLLSAKGLLRWPLW